jgi:SAM-dependent methyltransferase
VANRNLLTLHHGVAREQGYDLRPPLRVLDYGCGAGNHVYEYRDAGFEAYGYDIKDYVQLRHENDGAWFAFGPSVPFPDEYFDFVFSFQVFEHVHDHDSAIGEISRVLKRGGASFHCYPPKYRFIEGHTYVPLGGKVQFYPWLRLWAQLGVRNEFQSDLSASEVARVNKAWLASDTKYVGKAYITNLCRGRFAEVRYVEDAFLRYWPGRTHALAPLVNRVPALKDLVSTVLERALWLRR